MSRITRKNMQAAAESLARVLARWEILPTDHEVMVTGGSATYGVSWRVLWRPVGADRWENMPCVDMAGTYSLKDAHAKLSTAVYALSQLKGEIIHRESTGE